MSDDTDDIDLADPSEFDDPLSQRVIAFCHVAKLADAVNDEAVKEQCLTMLRRLNACVRTPPSAVIRSIDDGPRRNL